MLQVKSSFGWLCSNLLWYCPGSADSLLLKPLNHPREGNCNIKGKKHSWMPRVCNCQRLWCRLLMMKKQRNYSIYLFIFMERKKMIKKKTQKTKKNIGPAATKTKLMEGQNPSFFPFWPQHAGLQGFQGEGFGWICRIDSKPCSFMFLVLCTTPHQHISISLEVKNWCYLFSFLSLYFSF